MNPADRNSPPHPMESGVSTSAPDPIRQALAGQGALLGQHGQVLQKLTAQVAAISQTLANILQLHAQSCPPAPSPPEPPRSDSPPPREPYVLTIWWWPKHLQRIFDAMFFSVWPTTPYLFLRQI